MLPCVRHIDLWCGCRLLPRPLFLHEKVAIHRYRCLTRFHDRVENRLLVIRNVQLSEELVTIHYGIDVTRTENKKLGFLPVSNRPGEQKTQGCRKKQMASAFGVRFRIVPLTKYVVSQAKLRKIHPGQISPGTILSNNLMALTASRYARDRLFIFTIFHAGPRLGAATAKR